jgi:hypothetical protein
MIIAENNEEVKKTIHFYITTNELSEGKSAFVVLNEQNKAQGGSVLEWGEEYNLIRPCKLFLNCYPTESIANEAIRWSSKDASVAAVDANGFIYPEGRGKTEIYAVVKDKAGKEHTFTLKVSTLQAVARRTALYLSPQNINASFIADNILLREGLRIEQKNDKFFIYDSADEEPAETIDVRRITSGGEIGILNEDYFDTVYIGIGGYQVYADYLDYAMRGVPLSLRFSSSDTEILDVTPEGRLTPLATGEAYLHISLNGNIIISKLIRVSARATTFRLTRDNQSNRVGIKQEYVWAFNWLKPDENNRNILSSPYSDQLLASRLSDHTTNTYKGLKYIENSGQYLTYDNKQRALEDISLLWSVDNTDYARISDNGDITFYEAVCGKEVTATAWELAHGVKTGLSRSYTFKVIEDKTALNVDNIADFRGATEGYALTTVMHDNMFFDSSNPLPSPRYIGPAHELCVRSSVYGNGKILKSRKGANDYMIKLIIQSQYNDYSQDINSLFSPIVIENLELDGWDDATVPYEQADGDMLMQDIIRVYYHMGTHGEYYDFQEHAYHSESAQMRDLRLAKTSLRINYCYLHNGVKGITLYDMSNTEVTGSIFANFVVSAINIENRYSHLSALTLRRVVIRDTTGIGISGILYDNDNRFTANANAATKIIIKDFFDAYTWAPADGFGSLGKVIPREKLNQLPSSVNADALYSMIEVALRDIMQVLVEKNGLVMTYKGKDYAHLAILSLGLWAKSDPNRIVDETGQFKKVPFQLDRGMVIKSAAFPFPVSIGILETLLDVQTLSNTSVALSYDLNKGENAIVPDADCPSNVALYRRLQGQETQ